MTRYRTQGFDIALEVHEDLVALLTVGLLPELLTGRGEPFHAVGCEGTYEFLPATGAGSITLDTDIVNGVGIELPFTVTCALDSAPPGWPLAGTFSGRARITAPLIATQPTTTTTCLSVDFRALTEDQVEVVALDDPPPEWSGRAPAVRRLARSNIRQTLDHLGFFDVPPSITIDPENDGRDAFTPIRMAARVVRDGDTRSVVALLVTSPLTEADSSAITTTALTAGNRLVCMFGNELLLRRLIGLSLLSSLEVIDPDAEDVIGTLNGLLDFGGAEAMLAAPVDVRHLVDEWWASMADLRELSVSITEDERIAIRAVIFAGGPVVETRTVLEMSGSLEIQDARVVVHWHVDEPDVTITASPLLWVVAGPLAAIVLALKKVAARLLFGAMESTLTTEPFTLVSPEEWPEEPQALDVDSIFDVPALLPMVFDGIVLDDWGLTGRCTVPEPAYALPTPTLEIAGDWQVTDTGVAGMRAGWAPAGVRHDIITIASAHRGDFRAVAHGLALPIGCDWCLNGHALRGSGSVAIDGVTVSHEVDGARCRLSLESGDSLEGTLAVSALDARGIELFASRDVDVRGSHESHGFQGVELLEGPMAELGRALIEREPSPAERMSASEYTGMLRGALIRGMGIDPDSQGVRRPR